MATLVTTTEPSGATDLVLYLLDYEHKLLMPHLDVLPHGERPESATVDGTMAGPAFQSGTVLAAEQGQEVAGLGSRAGTPTNSVSWP